MLFLMVFSKKYKEGKLQCYVLDVILCFRCIGLLPLRILGIIE